MSLTSDYRIGLTIGTGPLNGTEMETRRTP